MKAFKSTALARRLADAGHTGLLLRHLREMEGMAAAGLGARPAAGQRGARRPPPRRAGRGRRPGHRGRRLARDRRRGRGRRRRARCSSTSTSGSPAAAARPTTPAAWPTGPGAAGLEVRGVMGYEGHLVGLEDRAARETGVAESMAPAAGGPRGRRRRGRVRRRHRHLGPQPLDHRAPGRLVPADGHRLRPCSACPSARPCRWPARSSRSTRRPGSRWPTSASRRWAWTTATPRWSTGRGQACGSAPTST